MRICPFSRICFEFIRYCSICRQSIFQVKNIIVNEEDSIEGADVSNLVIIKCNVEEDYKQFYEENENNKSTLEKNEFFIYGYA